MANGGSSNQHVDQPHLDLVGPAFIAVDAKDQGEMAFGALDASLDCDFTPNGIDFQGSDAAEGDQVGGDGSADPREDGGFLEGKISYHNGDETTFIASLWKAVSATC